AAPLLHLVEVAAVARHPSLPAEASASDSVALLRFGNVRSGFDPVCVGMAGPAGAGTVNSPPGHEGPPNAHGPLRATLLLAEQRLGKLLRGERRSLLLKQGYDFVGDFGHATVSLRNPRGFHKFGIEGRSQQRAATSP